MKHTSLHCCVHRSSCSSACLVQSRKYARSVESTEILGKPVPYYHLFNGLLSLLVLLHFYWFGLIAKIAWRALATGAPDDIREDSDED